MKPWKLRWKESARVTTGKAQSYYGNELQKLIESNVGTSSEYHYQATKSGVPVAANPYEYLGDLSVEFLKGEPTKSSEVFSPVSGELKSYLPTSGGLQEWAWNRAEGKNENVSYMPALAYLASAEGLEGPYGALYGLGTIQPYKSYNEAVEVALEGEREGSTGKAQSYYGNELQKLIESNVGTSSEYHYQATKSGVPVAANPYEYLGDLSVEFLKGEPTKSSEVFSPVSGELKSYLPASGGLQDWAWGRAEGKNENVSYMPALGISRIRRRIGGAVWCFVWWNWREIV